MIAIENSTSDSSVALEDQARLSGMVEMTLPDRVADRDLRGTGIESHGRSPVRFRQSQSERTTSPLGAWPTATAVSNSPLATACTVSVPATWFVT